MKNFTSAEVQNGALWGARSDKEPDGSHRTPNLEDLREAISMVSDLNGTEIDVVLNLPPRPSLFARFRRVDRLSPGQVSTLR